MPSDKLSAPDYTGIEKSIEYTTDKANKWAKKQWQWAKDMVEVNQGKVDDLVDQLGEISDFSMANADADQKRINDVFIPNEDKYISSIEDYEAKAQSYQDEIETLKQDAKAYGSEANQQYEAAKASAEVGQAFNAERESLTRSLEASGLNPASAQVQALDLGVQSAEALGKAGAGTQAADAVRQESYDRYNTALGQEREAFTLDENAQAMRGNVMNLGQAYADNVATSTGQAGTSNAQAVESLNQTLTTNTNAMTSAANYLNTATTGSSVWTDTLDTGFQNELDIEELALEEEKLEATESSGIGSAVGTAAGVLTSFLPGGSAVSGVTSIFAKEGGYVPKSASPSRGAVPDDVKARLTGGEYVIRPEVVKYYGEKFFEDLNKKMTKSRKGAVPA